MSVNVFDPAKLMTRLGQVEGDRTYPYDDATGQTVMRGSTVKGNLTIGIGRNLNANGLSPDEIDYLLSNDINSATKYLQGLFGTLWQTYGDVRQRALVEMVFNLGAAKFATFTTFIVAVRKADWNTASADLKTTLVYKELTSRYTVICKMLANGTE